MDLTTYRKEIDQIDDQIVRLFQERMDVADKIAAYKKEQGLPILQPAREREKLAEVSGGERRFECKGRLVSCPKCWYQIPVDDFPVSDEGIPLDQEINCPACHFSFTIN